MDPRRLDKHTNPLVLDSIHLKSRGGDCSDEDSKVIDHRLNISTGFNNSKGMGASKYSAGNKVQQNGSKNTQISQKKKSKGIGSKFIRFFTWGCRGKGKVSAPKIIKQRKPKKFQPGADFDDRDVKSEFNAHSRHDEDLLHDDTDNKSVLLKYKASQSSIEELAVFEPKPPEKDTLPAGNNNITLSQHKVHNTQKSIEQTPDEDISDISESKSSSKSDSEVSDQRSTNQIQGNEDADNSFDTIVEDKNSHVSEESNEAESDQDVSEGEQSEDTVQESEDSEAESDESEASDVQEERKETIQVRITEFSNNTNSDKSLKFGQFQDIEEDEISGNLLPSYCFNAMSSAMNEVSEHNECENDRISKFNSARREEKVGVPRRSTVIEDVKVWTIKEDQTILSIIEKHKIKTPEINWSKVASEVNKYRTNSFYERTSDE